MINVLLKEQKGIVVRFDHIHPRSAKYGHKASYGDMAIKEKLQEMFKVTTRILSKGKYYEY